MITPQQARNYLKAVSQTETGRDALRDLGFLAIIGREDKEDDASMVTVAERVRELLVQRYRLN